MTNAKLYGAFAAVLAMTMPVMSQAAPAQIERHKLQSSVPLLSAVTIPPGSELFFLSGQIPAPIDPSKPMSPALTAADMGDTKTQTISALNRAKAVLEAHGYTMSDVIKVSAFLVGDPALGGVMDFAGMNQGFKQFFGTAENPNTVVRSTFQVTAVAYPSFLIEVELIAAKAPKK